MPTSQPCWGRKEHSSSFHDRDHFHTSAATPRFTDVHGPAQCSQLFPFPSQLLYWLRLWHIQQQCLKNIFFFKKKSFWVKTFQAHVHFFGGFFPSCLFVLTTWLLPSSHIKSSLKVWISFSLLMQNWLREISEKHLRTSRESSWFSIVNNLNGCLKGWSRRETVAAALCFFQRPSKCAWLSGEKGNNCLKRWWFCVELLFPVLLEGNSCFLLESFDSF